MKITFGKARLVKMLSIAMTLTMLTGCGESKKSTSTNKIAPSSTSTQQTTITPTETTDNASQTAGSTSQATDNTNQTTDGASQTTESVKQTASATPQKTTAPTQTTAPTETPEDSTDDNVKKTAKIIILAGQSNAVGATLVTPLKTTVGSSRFTKLRRGYANIKIAYFAEAGGANGAANSFRTNIDYAAGKNQSLNKVFRKTDLTDSWTTSMFGPEVGIAEYLNEKYPGEEFFIVKVAKGGVSVADSWETGDYCYEKLKETMEICCTSLESAGYTPELFSICWIQGENEAASKALAEKYDSIVSGVAQRMRTDFAKYSTTGKIAFIDAGISDSSLWRFYKEVNEGKEKFAETSDLNYYFSVIDARLEYKNEPAGQPDLAHYDSASVVKLGNILGEYIEKAYKNM